MFNKKNLLVTLSILLTVTHSQAQNDINQHTITVPDNYTINQEPLQENITPFVVFENNRYVITALAKYSITARILHLNNYNDSKADIAPRDFALGWKAMSNPEFLSKIDLSQDDRFLMWTVGTTAKPVINAIETQSSNNHLIPSNDTIRQTLMNAKVGQNITVKGYLVNVRRGIDHFRWNTSLIRTDTGDGACEIIYVTEATINSDNDFNNTLTIKN